MSNKDIMLKYNVKEDDIAVIGISGRFAGADDLEDFWTNLINGKESIKEYPQNRKEEMEEMFPNIGRKDFIKGGYLDAILEFEPQIFSISFDESKYIDPEHRLLLELVEEAILDAGYNPEKLSNKSVGVFIGKGDSQYSKMIDSKAPMAQMNSIPSINVARIAYTYNFRGSVFTIGAGCTSSLVAVHSGCQSLKLHENDYVIAGGTEIVLDPMEKKDLDKSHVISRNQKIMAFSDYADGTVPGEGGGIVLLRRIRDAIEDNDNILAVIKGSNVNSNGSWSNGIVSPSQKGQAEAILKAVSSSKVDTNAIKYIETHGTGTKIGDPIEAEGISIALNELGYSKQSVGIGSLKPNIGHLNTAAGVASLIKVILSIKNKVIPPSINFIKPNSLINFCESPIFLNNSNLDVSGCENYVVGVSSTGFTGTNCHIVLQNFSYCENSTESFERILMISARTNKSLDLMLKKLYAHLRKHKYELIDDIAYTLNCGRRNFKNKFLLKAKDYEDLKNKLKTYVESGELNNNKEYYIFQENENIIMQSIFIYPDISDDFCENNNIYRNQSTYKKFYDDFMQKITCEKNINIMYAGHLYAYTKLVESYSIKAKAFLGVGIGEIIGNLISEKEPFYTCIERIYNYSKSTDKIDNNRLIEVIDKIIAEDINNFILFSVDTATKELFINVLKKKKNINLYNLKWNNDDFYCFIIKLIGEGLKVDWEKVYKNETRKKVQLPGYQFNRQIYYVKLKTHEDSLYSNEGLTTSDNYNKFQEDKKSVKEEIQSMFKEICAYDESIVDKYTYELSLDSISIMQFVGKIKKRYNQSIPVKLFFQGEKMCEIFEQIEEQIEKNSTNINLIRKQREREYYPLSSAQKRMYMLQELDKDSVAYNIPGVLCIDGLIEKNRLESALNELVIRHESFRTYFGIIQDEPVQYICKNVNFSIKYYETDELEADKIINKFIRPFNLSKAPLLRALLIKLNDKKYLLAFDMHHIISDGVSIGIFVNDLINIYKGEKVSKLEIQYKDFAIWQNDILKSESVKKQEKYWMNVFKKEIPELQLPFDYERTEFQSFDGDSIKIKIDKELRQKLYSFLKKNNSTLFMVLISNLYIILSKCTGEEDIVIGTPIAGRLHEDLEKIIGMFVNTLALRNFPMGEKSFIQFFNEVKNNSLEAFQNETYQFDELVSKLNLNNDHNKNALFNVMFAMQNMRTPEIKVDDMILTPYNFQDKTSRVDFELEVSEDDKDLIFRFGYCTKLFKRDTIKKISDDYFKLLDIVINNPKIKIKDIELENNYVNPDKIIADEVNFNF
ncbi:hypothetical protein KYB31_13010 [Clostridium felsineum]|uniref:condensation domain-containing protein n=1 Tax=Clostridium felsineum TaxID=36839 RepID=UPI00214DC11E|nr:condensation domain-containing protein [Clostridium felsineum]MCR3759888.1 hypothetical protein [Clostridium felsineum]